jgi:hypothetical protein
MSWESVSQTDSLWSTNTKIQILCLEDCGKFDPELKLVPAFHTISRLSLR